MPSPPDPGAPCESRAPRRATRGRRSHSPLHWSPLDTATPPSALPSVLGHEPVFGRERPALARPSLQAADHRVGLKARAAKRFGGHLRAVAHPAVEHDWTVALDGVRLRGQGGQLDVTAFRDVTGLPLMGLAHVDQLRTGVLLEPAGDPLWIDLDLGVLTGGAHDKSLAASHPPLPGPGEGAAGTSHQ